MNYVTISVGSAFPLRQEDAGLSKSIEFGSFPVKNNDGILEDMFFKNEHGEPSTLLISNVMTLNKKDPIQKYNLDTLLLMIKNYPEYGNDIIINDIDAEAEKEAVTSERSFEIESYIRSNKDNNELVAKLHRRVIGPVQGLTNIVVVNALISLAKSNPDAFVVRENFVYHDKSYEILSVIDACLEKGILSMDIGEDENTIRYRDGRIMAESLDKAAFYLSGHPDDLDTLYRLLDDKREKPLRYTPQIENAANVELSNTTKVEEIVKSSMTEDQLIEHINTTIPLLVDAGMLVRSGQGPTTRYAMFDMPGNQFTKRDLTAYFKQNDAQFQDLKTRGGING